MCYSFVSTYVNLPNSSCHFLKCKPVFLQNFASLFSVMKDNSFVLLQLKHYIRWSEEVHLNFKFWRLSSARVKIRQIPHVNFEMTINSSSNFASFFIVMTYNFSINFKLIHFLLWTKVSHQSPNFDIFDCSGENLPNSSCHFSN